MKKFIHLSIFLVIGVFACKLKELSQFGRQVENLVEETHDFYGEQKNVCRKQFHTEKFLLTHFSDLPAEELEPKIFSLEYKYLVKSCSRDHLIVKDFKDIMTSLKHLGSLFRAIGEEDRYTYKESREELEKDLIGYLARSRSQKSHEIKNDIKKLTSTLLINTPQNLSKFSLKNSQKKLKASQIRDLEKILKSTVKFTQLFREKNHALAAVNKTLWQNISDHNTYNSNDELYEFIQESKRLHTSNLDTLVHQDELLDFIEAGMKEIINYLSTVKKSL